MGHNSPPSPTFFYRQTFFVCNGATLHFPSAKAIEIRWAGWILLYLFQRLFLFFDVTLQLNQALRSPTVLKSNGDTFQFFIGNSAECWTSATLATFKPSLTVEIMVITVVEFHSWKILPTPSLFYTVPWGQALIAGAHLCTLCSSWSFRRRLCSWQPPLKAHNERNTQIKRDYICRVEASFEVKLPTVWTHEKQRWEESEKTREEERR